MEQTVPTPLNFILLGSFLFVGKCIIFILHCFVDAIYYLIAF